MAAEKFQDDDAGFRDWVARHGTGYVVNVERGLADQAGTRIHRASCFTLQPGSGGGDLQTESYIKICSWNPRELDQWAQAQLGAGLRKLRCRHCNPSELGLT
jgi:hypothetical protein